MGYTHYWKSRGGKAGFKKALPIIQQIIERHKDIIQFENDCNDDPICVNGLIRFNGIGEDGCETFYFTPDKTNFNFNFCPRRRAYDLPVCECLLVLNHCIPDLEVWSDGMSGCVEDEKDLQVNRIVENPDGVWGEALANVSKLYGISYAPVCWRIRDEHKYYDWKLKAI